MQRKKLTCRAVSFALLATFSTLPQVATASDPGMARPNFSREQIEQALSQGVDLRKVNTTPGIHVVPLSDSWSSDDQIKIQRTQIEQQRSRGFYLVKTGDLTDVRAAMRASASERRSVPRHDKAFRSMKEIQNDLLVEPIDLGNSALSTADLVEVRLGGSYVRGKWTGLARTFEVPDLGIVVLDERDHAATNDSVTVVQEWVNIDVNGHAGTAKTARDASGHSLISVGWTNERKLYSLQLQPSLLNAGASSQEKLVDIARKLVEPSATVHR